MIIRKIMIVIPIIIGLVLFCLSINNVCTLKEGSLVWVFSGLYAFICMLIGAAFLIIGIGCGICALWRNAKEIEKKIVITIKGIIKPTNEKRPAKNGALSFPERQGGELSLDKKA